MRLRALGAAADRGERADRLRARRHRPGPPGQARAAVLVLLRLQRLQQPARGRLGDDPARLRRRRRARGARRGSGRRSATARTREPSAPTGATTSSSSSTGRHPVVYPAAGSHANKFTEALYLGSSAEQGVGCDDTRGPHVELRPVVRDDPERPGGRARGVPVDRLRGTLGRAAAGVLQRPDRPEPEDAVDRADRVVGGLARRGATRCPRAASSAPVRPTSSAARSRRARAALVQLLREPGPDAARPRRAPRARVFAATRTTGVRRRRSGSRDGDAGARSSPPRAACTCGARRLFLGIGAALHPARRVISLVAGAVLGGFGLLGIDATGESAGALVLLVLAVGTTLTLLGLGARPGGDCLRTRRDRRRARDRPGPRLPRSRSPSSARSCGGLALAVAVWVVLTATAVLIPSRSGSPCAGRCSPRRRARGPIGVRGLRRSAELVRGRWLSVASLVGVGRVHRARRRPAARRVLIFVTDAPLRAAQRRRGRRLRAPMPFVALTDPYVYFDARVRTELAEGRRTPCPPRSSSRSEPWPFPAGSSTLHFHFLGSPASLGRPGAASLPAGGAREPDAGGLTCREG